MDYLYRINWLRVFTMWYAITLLYTRFLFSHPKHEVQYFDQNAALTTQSIFRHDSAFQIQNSLAHS